ncbi:hypothetical protein M1I95_16450 [Rossellomorea marisflavi]|uniref:hypothetical protein n=1 Tax=Rossellomorea marisflavi TaxID=189381 RepID=UPI0027A4E392|nr:hypothetical protein [Rossellomorea marisflavi]UTE71841.1 hypothetical protein M1I95_16450 [Rossellomorea marisflavi]
MLIVVEERKKMKCFHYHWWTDKVEEMEAWYRGIGFETRQRIGRANGEMREFNPPLEWDEFRQENVQFRIIEMMQGQVNITFGQGKRDRFDHIGFLVNDLEHDKVLKNAALLGWRVDEGERRTFISTPWRFRVELQRRKEAVRSEAFPSLARLKLNIDRPGRLSALAELLGAEAEDKGETCLIRTADWELQLSRGQESSLKSVEVRQRETLTATDPVGVLMTSII